MPVTCSDSKTIQATIPGSKAIQANHSRSKSHQDADSEFTGKCPSLLRLSTVLKIYYVDAGLAFDGHQVTPQSSIGPQNEPGYASESRLVSHSSDVLMRQHVRIVHRDQFVSYKFQ